MDAMFDAVLWSLAYLGLMLLPQCVQRLLRPAACDEQQAIDDDWSCTTGVHVLLGIKEADGT